MCNCHDHQNYYTVTCLGPILQSVSENTIRLSREVAPSGKKNEVAGAKKNCIFLSQVHHRCITFANFKFLKWCHFVKSKLKINTVGPTVLGDLILTFCHLHFQFASLLSPMFRSEIDIGALGRELWDTWRWTSTCSEVITSIGTCLHGASHNIACGESSLVKGLRSIGNGWEHISDIDK